MWGSRARYPPCGEITPGSCSTHHTTPHHTTPLSHYRTLQQYYSGKKLALFATQIVETLDCKMSQCVSCLTEQLTLFARNVRIPRMRLEPSTRNERDFRHSEYVELCSSLDYDQVAAEPGPVHSTVFLHHTTSPPPVLRLDLNCFICKNIQLFGY